MKIKVQDALNKVESDWNSGGLSDGMYAQYTCEVMENIISKLTKQLQYELSEGIIDVDQVQHRADQLIKYPDYNNSCPNCGKEFDMDNGVESDGDELVCSDFCAEEYIT